MSRVWVLIPLVLLQPAIAVSDSSNLEGGVFIAHHPPGLLYTSGQDWCAGYFQEFAIDSCSEQNSRIDLDGNQGQSSVWFVIAAWAEAKEWCGAEFGFADFDSTIYAFTYWGPCFPDGSGGGLQIPTAGWPGPNAGVSLSISGTAWSGNFVPVYYFMGYAYCEGEIPLAANPASAFGGTANCETPPATFAATAFGGMGIFLDGTYVCPEALDGGGGGLDGGTQPDGSGDYGGHEGDEGQGGGDEYPGSSGPCADKVVIIRFAPNVISFPQDSPDGPRFFEASFADAEISLPGLESLLEEVGAESFRTVAPNWRHLTPDRCRDIHDNPVDLVDFTDVYSVALSGAVSVDDAISRLWGEPGVVYVECDPRVSFYYTPNDSYFDQQWYLHNTGQGDSCLVGLDLGLPEAWDLCDSAGTKIGISDWPVNDIHEDLQPFIDTSLSASFGDPPLPWRSNGNPTHGTLVASLAAAGTNNESLGIASIPNLPPSHGDSIVVALSIMSPGMFPGDSAATAGSRALDYVCGPVVNGRIGIVNMSWGVERWQYCYDRSYAVRTLRAACRNAFRKGISLVCSAGNAPHLDELTACANPDTNLTYPAAFPDYCLAVAAIDCQGRLHDPPFLVGSYIDVAGPGHGMWAASSGTNGYEYLSGWGTSLASPVVSGAITLLLGADPALTNEDCYSLLKLTANPVDGLSAVQAGAGIPRLDRALTWVVPPCGVVHDSIRTTAYEADSLGEWSLWFMNVEGVNDTAETWQDFQVVPYRVTVEVQLPTNTHVLQVWPRGSHSAGWRLIDERLDGNPDPHYDALFYDNWARIVSWGGGSQCTFECYTYKVLGESIRWVPFRVGDDYWLNYSYVACDSLPLHVGDGNEGPAIALQVLGSPARSGGVVSLRMVMPDPGRLWLAIYGPDGRLVRRLARGTPIEAGMGKIQWDLREQSGGQVSAGMYFVRMKATFAGGRRTTRDSRVVVVR